MKHVSQFGLPKKRKQTLDILEKAFTEGNLDPHDYENRLDMVMQADSVEKLDLVLSDFPEQYRKESNVSTSSSSVIAPENHAKQNHNKLSLNVLAGKSLVIDNVSTSSSRIFTIIGEQKISFSDPNLQNTKSDYEVVTIVGETSVDLRNQCLEGAVIKLRMTKVVGEVNIKVLPGTIVEDRTKKILSEYTHVLKSKTWKNKIYNAFSPNREDGSQKAAGKVNCHLILEGFSILGAVNVTVYDI
ncbi:DUF1707 domain-containing protein [Flammeovirga aprica]|uniref:DUF1707 domain-containing protein n=1 Tax=Flammeovirga aprica JL-4 TaxID=694437 RepID=A0A7X9RWJ9_9BACT|nr:DUF1707 domain-containing protein [Flammeovirga aprica]NME70041.1 DUF1707 domain-containing protein [Flammeovirga aprica JL-4]